MTSRHERPIHLQNVGLTSFSMLFSRERMTEEASTGERATKWHIAYNRRYIIMRGQTVRIVRFMKEEHTHAKKYEQNPHDAHRKFTQTRRCATPVSSTGSR